MRWCATSIRDADKPMNTMAVANCNDQIAAKLFGAEHHFPMTMFERLRDFDAVFATMWKVQEREKESRWMNVLHRLKDETDTKVVLFQEAETAWPTTRPWDEQKSFYELLGKVDLLLTHNQRDVLLWGQFRKDKPTLRWRTAIDVDLIARYRIEPEDKPTKPILFGSSFDQRANGLVGLVACKDLGRPLWHQNRNTWADERNNELPKLLGVRIEKEIPMTDWAHWLKSIAGAYVAVHPMPAAAAGRDQIAFAALGIPCVGNWELDIQRELFPNMACADIYNPDIIQATVQYQLLNDQTYKANREYAMVEAYRFGLEAGQQQADTIKKGLGWS